MAHVPSNTTITSSSAAAPKVDLPLVNELAAIRSGMREDGLPVPLSDPTRDRLSNRLTLLRGCVKQATAEQIEHEVAKLMTSYPSLRGASSTDAAAMVYQYAEALAGVPLWAVRDACKAIACGGVPDLNLDFAPSAPRLRSIVDGYVSPIHKEAREIKEVLQARVTLPDDSEMAKRVRERVYEGLKQRSRELDEFNRQSRQPDGPARRAPTPDEIVAHYAAHGLGFKPKPQRNERDFRDVTDDVTDDVTFQDRYAAGGQ